MPGALIAILASREGCEVAPDSSKACVNTGPSRFVRMCRDSKQERVVNFVTPHLLATPGLIQGSMTPQ